MKKNISFLIIISMFFLNNCQRHEVIKTHGLSYLDKRQNLVFINKSNKNDTIKILGHPSTTGMTDNNTWIYIERTITRGKMLKLGRNYLKKKQCFSFGI